VGAQTLTLAPEDALNDLGVVPGYASPIGIDPSRCELVIDPSAAHSAGLVVGANEVDAHYRNFNLARDMAEVIDAVKVIDVAAVCAGDPCPTGGVWQGQQTIGLAKLFRVSADRGARLSCTYLDESGRAQPVVVTQFTLDLLAVMEALVAQRRDRFGPIWPLVVAPAWVHVVALNRNRPEVLQASEQLYKDLRAAGLSTLIDDRNRRAGFAFADADLLGAPVRLVVGPKTLREGEVELRTRDGARRERVPLEQAVQAASQALQALRDAGGAPLTELPDRS